LEEDFQTLFKCVSLTYSARQKAKLKRRWPLSKVVVDASDKVCACLGSVEELFLELANVKKAEYVHEPPADLSSEEWVSAVEDDVQVFLNVQRDEKLLGEGLMRDLARRVQALRKELGYMPSDVLDAVHIAELDEESVGLLEPYLKQMEELVRARKIRLSNLKDDVLQWHECQMDDKKILVAIS